jgi:hypothetical protein
MDIEPRLLKTPTSQLGVNGGSQHPDKRKAGGHGPTLADEIEHLLPTPSAQEPGFTMEPVDKHGNRPKHGAQRWYHPETGRLLQKGVSQVIANLLPSPRASDGEKGGPNQKGSKGDLMLPSAVTRIGASTSRPSAAGNEYLEDQLPGQLNLLDAITDTA